MHARRIQSKYSSSVHSSEVIVIDFCGQSTWSKRACLEKSLVLRSESMVGPKAGRSQKSIHQKNSIGTCGSAKRRKLTTAKSAATTNSVGGMNTRAASSPTG